MRLAVALALAAACTLPSATPATLSNHADPTPLPPAAEMDWRAACRRTGGRPLCFRVFVTPDSGMIRCGCCPARTSYEACRMWL